MKISRVCGGAKSQFNVKNMFLLYSERHTYAISPILLSAMIFHICIGITKLECNVIRNIERRSHNTRNFTYTMNFSEAICYAGIDGNDENGLYFGLYCGECV